MQYLTYQFSRQADWESDFIALVGAGDFSHVDIVLDDGTLLGARADGGVQIRAADYAKWVKQVCIDVPCVEAQKGAALRFALDQVGKPYDKLAIVAFVVGRDWRSDGAWFCSELGARVGEVGCLWPSLYSPANRINPVELALVASAAPGRVIRKLK